MKEHLIPHLKYVIACNHNQTGCFKIRVCRLHLCDNETVWQNNTLRQNRTNCIILPGNDISVTR